MPEKHSMKSQSDPATCDTSSLLGESIEARCAVAQGIHELLAGYKIGRSRTSDAGSPAVLDRAAEMLPGASGWSKVDGSDSSGPSAESPASAELGSAASGLEGSASSSWGCVASGTEACGQETLTLHEHPELQGGGCQQRGCARNFLMACPACTTWAQRCMQLKPGSVGHSMHCN